jgi:hypothetical protein
MPAGLPTGETENSRSLLDPLLVKHGWECVTWRQPARGQAAVAVRTSEPLSAAIHTHASVSRDTRDPRAVTDQIRPARRCGWRARASHPRRPLHSGSPQASQWPAHQACFESRVQIAVRRFSTERRAAGSWRSARIRLPARRQCRRPRCSLQARQPPAPRRTRRRQENSRGGMRAARTRQTGFDDPFRHERLDSQRTRIPVYARPQRATAESSPVPASWTTYVIGHRTAPQSSTDDSSGDARLDAAARDAKRARLAASEDTPARRAREDRLTTATKISPPRRATSATHSPRPRPAAAHSAWSG